MHVDNFARHRAATDRPISFSIRQAESRPTTPYDRHTVGLHHIAFAALSRDSVDERHRWLVESGAQIESEPREYPYTEGYYAVFFYDPDGRSYRDRLRGRW